MGGKEDLHRAVQEIEIWRYYQMVYAKARFCSGTREILWDLEIQTDYVIPVRWPYVVIIKKLEPTVLWILPSRRIREQKSKKTKRETIFRPGQRPKKTVEHESDGNTISYRSTWNGPQRLRKVTERVGNWKTNREYLNYRVAEIGQNTEKSPGDLRLAATPTPGEDH